MYSEEGVRYGSETILETTVTQETQDYLSALHTDTIFEVFVLFVKSVWNPFQAHHTSFEMWKLFKTSSWKENLKILQKFYSFIALNKLCQSLFGDIGDNLNDIINLYPERRMEIH